MSLDPASQNINDHQAGMLDQLVQDQANGYDSLLGCLLLVCRSHGVATTADALTSGLPLNNGKLTPALFKRAAERANLSVTTLKKPINFIRPAFMPVTLLLKRDEACQISIVHNI